MPRKMWESLRPVSQEFVFYIQGYGRFGLEFDLPIGRFKV